MEEVPLTEADATHDDDFSEHLNMRRTRTFRGKEKNSFVHWYQRNKKKGESGEDQSHHILHGIMHYHGYEHKSDKATGKDHFHKDEDHKSSKVVATTNDNGHVVRIDHHERFKNVDESINEVKLFAKTLRSIVPKKSKLPVDGAQDTLNVHSAPSEKAESKKLLGLRDIIKFPSMNGNNKNAATFNGSAPNKKAEAPDVGYKEPMHKIKEDVEPIDELTGKGKLNDIAGHHAGKEMHHSFQARRDRVETGNPDARGHDSKAKVAAANVARAKNMRNRVFANQKLKD